ncbi:MAG: DUF1838 family protein [Pseudomonadota bacterium]|nr:DUF1838 family protein [Pseudomonadota bacterium]
MTVRVLKSSSLDTGKDPVLDLDDPETNFMALLKLRGDLSGADFHFAFPGQAWAMIPQEQNYRCFRTFGFGSGKYEQVDGGYRIYSREVLYYMDPDSGEILEEWDNPFLGGRKVKVVHIANDPVNGVFSLKGPGPLTPPYPYVSYGDHVAFQWNFFIQHPAAMNRKDYPLYSSGDIDQHAELWGLMGRKSDILDDTTSAYCTMSWSRVADWLPFMEMGNQPGKMVFHSHSMKLMNGPEELPRPVLDYVEKNHSEYLTAPTEWNGPQMTSSAAIFKSMVDSERN